MNIKQFNSTRKSLNRSMSENDDFFEAFGKLDDVVYSNRRFGGRRGVRPQKVLSDFQAFLPRANKTDSLGNRHKNKN